MFPASNFILEGVMENVVKACGSCENNVANLDEALQDALAEHLNPVQRLDVQIGLCDGCPLAA